jgi:hypothetical protein
VVFLVLFFFLHLDNPKTPLWEGLKAIDWLGSLTIVGATLMLLLGLEFGGVTYPWGSAKVICLIIFGLVVGGLFVLNEWKFARYPVMPLRLFQDPSNIASLIVCFSHGYVFIAGTYYLPLYFQAVIGASPLLSGIYVLPFALALSIVSGITGVVNKRTGKYKPAIIFGLLMMTLGFGLLIDLEVGANWAKIIIFEIIAGIGTGPNFQSPLLALQAKIAPRDIATATATFGFIRNLSTSISVVIGGVVFQNQMAQKSAYLSSVLGSELANQIGGASAGASVGLVQALPSDQQVIIRQAFFDSLRAMWIMYAAFSVVGLLSTYFISTTKLSKEHQITKTGLAAEEANRREMKEQKRAERASKELADGTRSRSNMLSDAV